MEIPPIQSGAPEWSLDEIEAAAKQFNLYIGGYPPRFASADQREQIYIKWSRALTEARRHDTATPGGQRILYLLSELFRQGHNVDVRGAGQRAAEIIDVCLARFPRSIPCNFSASYFYLSVNPELTPRGEKALLTLREVFAPEVNLEVERGLVHAYLLMGRQSEALKQVRYYLAVDPNAQWARQIEQALESGSISVREAP